MNPCDDIAYRRHENLAEADGELFQLGLQYGQLTRKVVLHGGRHFLRLAVAGIDGGGQVGEILIRGIDNSKPARHGVLAEDRGSSRGLLGLGEPGHLLAQRDHGRAQIDGPVVICHKGNVVLVHIRLHLLGGLGKVGQTGSKRCTGLGRLDAGICHQTQGNGRIFRGYAQCSCDRRRVFERLAEHADIGIGIGAGGGKDIGKVSRIVRFQPKGRQCVRYDIGGGRQVFTGSRREVHDALDAVQHVTGLPAGHGHVFHGGRSLGRAELCLRAHLAGFLTERFQIVSGCAGDGGDLAHAGVKVGSSLDCSGAEADDGGGGRQELLTDTGYALADRLQLFAFRGDLLKRCARLVGGCLQLLELLLCFDDLSLERVILLLGDLAFRQRLIGLLCGGLQRLQLFLRLFDGVRQELMLLGKELRIAGIQFEQLLDILELGLGVFDLGIDALERGLEFCRISADLYGYALDIASGHAGASFPIRL